MQGSMQPPAGVAAVLAVLEEEMHNLLRQKLALQTELHLAEAAVAAGLDTFSSCSSNALPQVAGLQSGLLLHKLQQLVLKNQQLEAALMQLLQERNKPATTQQQGLNIDEDAAAPAQQPAAAGDGAIAAAADDSHAGSVPMLALIQRQQQMLTQLMTACEQQQLQQQGSAAGRHEALQTAAQQVSPVSVAVVWLSVWAASCAFLVC
jgi:hypothetical protein